MQKIVQNPHPGREATRGPAEGGPVDFVQFFVDFVVFVYDFPMCLYMISVYFYMNMVYFYMIFGPPALLGCILIYSPSKMTNFEK